MADEIEVRIGGSGVVAGEQVKPDAATEARCSLCGAAAEVVASVRAEIEADLLVLGMTGHAGPRGLVVDGTAERVLQGVRGSVLAVKPVTAVAARRAV